MNKTPPNIQLHIDELILHGFSPADRSRIAEVIQTELARLFASKGVPRTLTQGGAVPVLDGAEFEFTPGMSAQAIGLQVAQSIYGGLNP